jgi:hypothetical protein
MIQRRTEYVQGALRPSERDVAQRVPKEHQKVEDLKKDFQATVAQLTAQLREQSAQIPKGERPA